MYVYRNNKARPCEHCKQ